jgi:hypothetical protein
MSNIVEKWMRVSAASEESYKEGIQNPRKDWARETALSESNYKAAVTKAASEGRFGKGVRQAGTEKWQRNAIAKGPARWSQGINLSSDAYSTGFAPYRQVIESTKLPDRRPKGDPANIDRVRVMAAALHEAKIRMKGGK